MNNRIWRLITITLLLLVIGGLFVYLPLTLDKTPSVQTQQEASVSVTIPNVYFNQKVSINPNETVLTLLERINQEDPKLQLVTKEYAGLGTLVEAMGGLQNGTEDKYWSYYVNGEMAQMGAGAYVLKDKDQIEWRFAKYEQ